MINLYFIIICHKKTASLIYNLEKFATFKNSKVLVHIDKKSTLSHKMLPVAENIVYSKDRIDVRWGGVEQIYITYKLLQEIGKSKYDYVSILSGEDVFIKTEKEFSLFITKNYGKEFIGIERNGLVFLNPEKRFSHIYNNVFYESNPSVYAKIRIRIYKFLFLFLGLKNRKPRPYNVFFKGSNWFTISKKAADLIVAEITLKNQIDFYKNSFCCDEVAFQTIIANNMIEQIYRISENIDDNKMSLRYIDWCSGPEYPKVLSEIDLLANFDGEVFFVRKISPSLSSEDLKKIFRYDN